jgi:Thermostable hemolysin
MPFSLATAAGCLADNPARAWPRVVELPRGQGRDPRRIVVVTRSHALRAQSEACIRDIYKHAFGAQNLSLPSTLLALVAGRDRLLCASGLRTAQEGFFSEIYLDMPIERILSTRCGAAVGREAIFEITTMASRSVEGSCPFLKRLALIGARAGFRWAFFTATARLRALLTRIGIPILDLGAADPGRLSDASCWGNYYAHAPRVCAVDDRWLGQAVARQVDSLPYA